MLPMLSSCTSANDNPQSDPSVHAQPHCMLLFLGVPEGTELGIDYNVWETGPRFKGLSGVPCGMHFIYYSTGTFRSGFFLNIITDDQIHVWHWCPKTETLVLELDLEQLQRFKHNIHEFLPHMGPYPVTSSNKSTDHLQQERQSGSLRKWLRLSSYISQQLVARTLPDNGYVSAMTSTSYFSDIPLTTSSTNLESVDANKHDTHASDPSSSTSPTKMTDQSLDSSESDHRIHFVPITLKHSFPPGSTGTQVTKYSLDKSYLLETLIKNNYLNDHTLLLGEFQLAFVIFLLGQVYDGFDQWKALVQLVCLSCESIATRPDFFVKFIDLLRIQLEECPQDFFYDALASGSFLHVAIKAIVSTCRDPDVVVPPTVSRCVSELSDFMKTRFNWDVSEHADQDGEYDATMDDEYEPVMVE
ncbi:hypothetical protein O5D80_004829 [Batrachochytrium dendrobatidis]|nr:hypothetical protein O5D80_004829 [Batrachochytrium dendrobatidis]